MYINCGVAGRQGSMSSEDTPRRGVGVGEGLASPQEEELSDDDVLTLEEFLQESNRSPASRVRF